MRRRFVVLDRDGTIIVERHFLSDPGQVELLPGAAAALRKLAELGLGLVVLTNQSGIGRGLFDLTQLDRVHRRLQEVLASERVRLDGIYYCPHSPDDNCACRKPGPGLLKLAAKELGFMPGEGFVVGDKASDVELGKRVGATTFLVRTGYGARTAAEATVAPDYVVDSLEEMSLIIASCLALEKA